MSLVLKPGKEKTLLRHHPWIFSGAIASFPPCEPGEVVTVYSAGKILLGAGYFHPRNSLAVRMLSFGEEPALEALRRNIRESIQLRSIQDARRLINAEGDELPGLI